MVICVLILKLDQLIFKNCLFFVEILYEWLIFFLEYFILIFENSFVVNENFISVKFFVHLLMSIVVKTNVLLKFLLSMLV
jgi:hypothetical protein